MKKIIALVLCTVMIATLFAGCFGGKSKTGEVYYLNFKPEQDEAWQKLAAKYTEKTGITVNVLTAAEGKYQETLTAEMDKNKMPTHIDVLADEYGLEKNSVILLEQIRTLDKKRLREKMGHLDESVMSQVNSAISVSFGL